MSTVLHLQERQQPINAPRLRDRVAAQRATPRASARHQPAATVPSSPVEAPRARWHVITGSIVATLRDIGIGPGDVDYEMRQPFWRPLRDWRA